MMDGNLSQWERFAEELRSIRGAARLTVKELARLSGIGTTTIKVAERSEAIPKTETVRLLADGAATDGEGHRDPVKAEAYYARLMAAAGRTPHIPPDPSAPPSFDLDVFRQQLLALVGEQHHKMLSDALVEVAKLPSSDQEFAIRSLWLQALGSQAPSSRRP